MSYQVDGNVHPEHDSNSGETLHIIMHSEGENMSMQTIARGFEAILWTVVCVKIEENAQEMGIEYSKYKTNTLLTGVIWHSHRYLPPKHLSLPPNYINDLGKLIELVLKIRTRYIQQLPASSARHLLSSPTP